jgi:integrase
MLVEPKTHRSTRPIPFVESDCPRAQAATGAAGTGAPLGGYRVARLREHDGTPLELRTVMELLEHSTIRLTADTYGHVLPARARQAVSAMDDALGEQQ